MENTSYDEILETVISELTERGIREQREANPAIKAMLKEQAKLSAKAQKCLNSLDAETKKTLVRYYEQAEAIADEQIRYIYLQGAKDCALLLKSLGII